MMDKKAGTCSSGDRAVVSGTTCRGFESLQVRYFCIQAKLKDGGKHSG